MRLRNPGWGGQVEFEVVGAAAADVAAISTEALAQNLKAALAVQGIAVEITGVLLEAGGVKATCSWCQTPEPTAFLQN